MTGQLPHRGAGLGGDLASACSQCGRVGVFSVKVGCHSGSRNISRAGTVALRLLSPLLHGRSIIMSNALARPGVR